MLLNTDAEPGAGAIARRIVRQFLSGAPDPPTRPLGLSERAAVEGLYRIGPEDTRRVYEKGGTLYSRRNASEPIELVALSPTRLTLAGSDATFVFEFEIGDDGRATHMRSFLSCEPVDSAVREEETYD